MPVAALQEDIELVTVTSGLVVSDSETVDSEALPLDTRQDNDQEREQLLQSSPVGPSPCVESCRYARRLLYLSHAFAQFSEFAWVFSITIFLSAITNYKSLLLVSTYGFTTQLAVFLASPRLGVWVDQAATNRLRAARILIGLENASLWIATLGCFVLLSSMPNSSAVDAVADLLETETAAVRPAHYENVMSSPTSLALLACIHLFGSAVRVLDQAFTVAIERDWVVEMSRASAKADGSAKGARETPGLTTEQSTTRSFPLYLAEMNVTMKQIDLSCKIIGPALAGLLLPLVSSQSKDLKSTRGLEWGCLLVGLLNTLALVVEYMCTTRIYIIIPSLAYKQEMEQESNSHSDDADVAQERWAVFHFCISRELRVYLEQPIALEGISLSLLYCNGYVKTVSLRHLSQRMQLTPLAFS